MQDVRVRFEIRNMVTGKEITQEFKTGTDAQEFEDWAYILIEAFNNTFVGKFKEAEEAWKKLDKLEQ